MSITNGYTTLVAVKAALRLTDSTDDTLLEQAVESASRRVDSYCGRFFYQTTATILIDPLSEYICALPADLVSATTIKTDSSGDATYATTLTANIDYRLTPYDATLQSRPYRQIEMVGGKTFPVNYSALKQLAYVPSTPVCQVAGVWGWSAIPADVAQATILLAMRQFARLNAALGIVGFADQAITVKAVDPDVRDLLNPYRLFGVA